MALQRVLHIHRSWSAWSLLREQKEGAHLNVSPLTALLDVLRVSNWLVAGRSQVRTKVGGVKQARLTLCERAWCHVPVVQSEVPTTTERGRVEMTRRAREVEVMGVISRLGQVKFDL